MKLKELIKEIRNKRITGFSTPVFGLTWESYNDQNNAEFSISLASLRDKCASSVR